MAGTRSIKSDFRAGLLMVMLGIFTVAVFMTQRVHAQSGKADPARPSISQGIGQPAPQAIERANIRAWLNPDPARLPDRFARNSAPQIISQPVLQAVPGLPYVYQPQAIDAEADSLSWQLLAAPASMQIDSGTGMLAAATLAPGEHAVSLQVEDGKGGSDSQQFVISLPSGPVIISIPPALTYKRTPYRYDFDAYDPSGQPLIYSIADGPAGMQIEPDTGVVEWFADTPGEFVIDLNVSSTSGQRSIQSFTLSVIDPGAVRIVSEPETAAYVLVPYQYQVSLLDAGVQGVGYHFNRAPVGMTITPETGVVEWTPALAGNHVVELVATSTNGSTHTQLFTVAVRTLEEMDQMFDAVLDGLFDQLRSGDVGTAMQYLTPDGQRRLGPLFVQLQDSIEEIAANYADPVRVAIGRDTAEYMVRRTGGNGDRVFMISYLRDEAGNWRINDL